MSSLIRNAIIMAAGTSSRFVPLSSERPKGLLEVKGEVLIERQIRQLKEAGISDITIVVGYKAEQFSYLKKKFNVSLVVNEDFSRYNNASSIIRVLDRLSNTYICSSDNYFPGNVFWGDPTESYYSALYAKGATKEYCLSTDEKNFIIGVTIGGRDTWYMVGHVYFSDDFSRKFRELLKCDYEKETTRHGYWEDVYIKHINELPKMKMRCYQEHDIEEFDSLDELRIFDKSYLKNTRSSILKSIAGVLNCGEDELYGFTNIPHNEDNVHFHFSKGNDVYEYDSSINKIRKI